jgi:hypothetical protein
MVADPSCRAVYLGLQPLAWWEMWVRISQGEWMSVSCECRVLSGRGLCDGLITRPEESCRMWCVQMRMAMKTRQ